MSLPEDLLIEYFGSGIRVISKTLQLLLCHIRLRYLYLPLNTRCYRVLELSLNRLRSPEHISELLRKRVVNSLLHPCLWLIRLRFLTLFYVDLHQRQICLDPLEVVSIRINEFIQYIRSYCTNVISSE